jgi:hypothetical protein
MTPRGSATPLVTRLTRRLVGIALAVLVASVTGFGLYYTQDSVTCATLR